MSEVEAEVVEEEVILVKQVVKLSQSKRHLVLMVKKQRSMLLTSVSSVNK